MNELNWFLAPLFVHVALTVSVGVRNVTGRVAAVQSGETRLRDVAIDSSNWPPRLRKISNNFDNQFDLPMVWLGLSALVVATGKIDTPLIIMSWAFIISRLVHSYIHTGSNHLPSRMYAYITGIVLVVAMWVWFGFRLVVNS
jgi:hypothetical protein